MSAPSSSYSTQCKKLQQGAGSTQNILQAIVLNEYQISPLTLENSIRKWFHLDVFLPCVDPNGNNCFLGAYETLTNGNRNYLYHNDGTDTTANPNVDRRSKLRVGYKDSNNVYHEYVVANDGGLNVKADGELLPFEGVTQQIKVIAFQNAVYAMARVRSTYYATTLYAKGQITWTGQSQWYDMNGASGMYTENVAAKETEVISTNESGYSPQNDIAQTDTVSVRLSLLNEEGTLYTVPETSVMVKPRVMPFIYSWSYFSTLPSEYDGRGGDMTQMYMYEDNGNDPIDSVPEHNQGVGNAIAFATFLRDYTMDNNLPSGYYTRGDDVIVGGVTKTKFYYVQNQTESGTGMTSRIKYYDLVTRTRHYAQLYIEAVVDSMPVLVINANNTTIPSGSTISSVTVGYYNTKQGAESEDASDRIGDYVTYTKNITITSTGNTPQKVSLYRPLSDSMFGCYAKIHSVQSTFSSYDFMVKRLTWQQEVNINP